MIISQEEFIDQYVAGSAMPREIILRRMVAVPCDCDYSKCLGWRMVVKYVG